jgi:hypothetical protein
VAKLSDQLADLGTMSATELRDAWRYNAGSDVPAFATNLLHHEGPPDLPPSLLRRALAFRLQEQAYGGLPGAVQRMLTMLSRDLAATPVELEIRLKPGTRLLREWNGKLHTVLVTDTGLLFEGRLYASLSHIAREITGAHWSGPRFFGLRKPVHPPRQVSANG